MMHTLAAGRIVGSVRKRLAQGDCPTEPAFDRETLEDALLEVHRLYEAEFQEREQLKANWDRVAKLNNELRHETQAAREQIEHFQSAAYRIHTMRLNWGLACQCKCAECDILFEGIRDLLPEGSDQP